jgi:putative transposase
MRWTIACIRLTHSGRSRALRSAALSWHDTDQRLVEKVAEDMTMQGLLLKAKVHSAKVPDQDGLRLLLQSALTGLSRLKHLWLDAGYEGRGRRWAEEAMGLSVDVVRKPPKPVPEEVAKLWAEEWAKEGKQIDWQRLMPPRGYVALPRRWVVERTFSWLSQNRRMSKDYERLCASAEVFIYAAMIRLMVRRLVRL